jgi:PadR family transcriptional regulator, regulatory protein PadR
MVVMNLVDGRDCHGYDMVRRLKELKELAVREGNIYPILARLQVDGLVRAQTLPSTDGPPQKHYSLTKAGRQALRCMNEHWDGLVDSLHRLRNSCGD